MGEKNSVQKTQQVRKCTLQTKAKTVGAIQSAFIAFICRVCVLLLHVMHLKDLSLSLSLSLSLRRWCSGFKETSLGWLLLHGFLSTHVVVGFGVSLVFPRYGPALFSTRMHSRQQLRSYKQTHAGHQSKSSLSLSKGCIIQLHLPPARCCQMSGTANTQHYTACNGGERGGEGERPNWNMSI